MNYYNEHDPKAAAWLRELIAAGHIPPGDVDTRSIVEVRPHEIAHYTQQHFFAGIGGWSLALRLAGWPDDRPVRTGSCPCQPFSQAGKGLGTKDERHLWPVFRDLITFGEPTVTFGEQVASKAGRAWLAGVRSDLEGLGYAIGAADLCAAGAGAPHIRQRLFWLADPASVRHSQRKARNGNGSPEPTSGSNESRRTQMVGMLGPSGRCSDGGMADSDGRDTGTEWQQRGGQQRQQPEDGGTLALGDPNLPGCGEQRRAVAVPQELAATELRGNAWDRYDILPCTDGKARRVEPGTFPLAHGIPGRVGLLRGYGNAIVPQVAAEFVRAFADLSTANDKSPSVGAKEK